MSSRVSLKSISLHCVQGKRVTEDLNFQPSNSEICTIITDITGHPGKNTHIPVHPFLPMMSKLLELWMYRTFSFKFLICESRPRRHPNWVQQEWGETDQWKSIGRTPNEKAFMHHCCPEPKESLLSSGADSPGHPESVTIYGRHPSM